MFWVNLLIYFLLAVYVIICVLMVLVILMQRSKQDGIGAAFGGGMMDSAFGPSTSNVLVKSTVMLAVIYFGITLSLGWLYAYSTGVNEVGRKLGEQTTLQEEEKQVSEAIGKEDAAMGTEPKKETISGSPIVNESEEASNPAPAEEPPAAPADSDATAPVDPGDLAPGDVPPTETPAKE